jgi:hypothetical protein
MFTAILLCFLQHVSPGFSPGKLQKQTPQPGNNQTDVMDIHGPVSA